MLEYSYPDYTGDEPCVQVGVDMFYYDYEIHAYSLNEARQIEYLLTKVCSECPLLVRCATYAIQHEEYGFWGGMSSKQRDEYRKKNNVILQRIYWEKF